MTTATETKACTQCHHVKPLTDFYVARGRHRSECKECTKDRSTEWQRRNRDRVNDNVRRWRQENPDVIRVDAVRSAANRAALRRLREAHRVEFDRLYDEELRERGLR